MIWCWGLPALILYYVVLYWNQPAVYSSVGADYLSFGDAFWIMHYVHLPYTQFLHLQPPAGISGIERVAIKLNKRRRLMELLAYTSWVSLRSVHSCNYIILPTYYGRPLSVAWAKSMLYFANVFFKIYFHGRLMLRPRLTEVRESFTCFGPWVWIEKLLLGFFPGPP